MDLRDLFFPKSCLNCRKPGKYLCEQCLSKVPKARDTCPQCNRYSFNGKTHQSCATPLSIDGHIAMWKYEGVIRKGVHAFKYRFAYDIAGEFAKSIQLTSFHSLISPLLVPIPLHSKRENWRGFNQSALLANRIANKYGFKCVENILIRIENTTPQAQLGKKERMQNIRGKFAVNASREALAKWERIVLVDDVWTTGSTMKEAAKVLKKAGAKEVWGLTLAS